MESYGELVKLIFALVEAHLHAPLNLDDISARVGLSPYHLHRVVHEITGRSLIAYLRARRLSSSLADLLETDRRIVDIAMDYCFEYEQSYIRAFGRQFALSPGAYRRTRPVVPVVESIREREWSALGEDGIVVSPRVVMIPGYSIAGKKKLFESAEGAVPSAANGLANEVYALRDRLMSGIPASNAYTGIVGHSGNDLDWHYVSGFGIPESSRCLVPEPLAVFRIPTNRYVTFSWIIRCHPSRLLSTDLLEFYRLVFDGYVPSSTYRFPFPWHLELIDIDACADDYGVFRLALPLDAEGT